MQCDLSTLYSQTLYDLFLTAWYHSILQSSYEYFIQAIDSSQLCLKCVSSTEVFVTLLYHCLVCPSVHCLMRYIYDIYITVTFTRPLTYKIPITLADTAPCVLLSYMTSFVSATLFSIHELYFFCPQQNQSVFQWIVFFRESSIFVLVLFADICILNHALAPKVRFPHAYSVSYPVLFCRNLKR